MTAQLDENTTAVVGTNWQLNAITAALGHLSLTIDDSLSIGRGSDNDVVLGSKQVSRNHAVLSVLNGKLYVKDLNSSNGTFINDTRIEGNRSSILQANDTLGFASFVFEVIKPVAVDAPIATSIVETSIIETAVIADIAVEDSLIEANLVEEGINTDTTIDAPSSPEALSPEVLNPKSSSPELHMQPAPYHDATVAPERDKTPVTALQEQADLDADPDILRVKQAATGQLSEPKNLGQTRDLDAQGNNVTDQALDNSANAVHTNNKSSGGWFILIFIAVVLIGLGLWFFNGGTA